MSFVDFDRSDVFDPSLPQVKERAPSSQDLGKKRLDHRLIFSDYKNYFRDLFTDKETVDLFINFLSKNFFELDEKKVLEGMKRLLEDETKSDYELYQDLLLSVDQMKKPLAGLYSWRSFYQLRKSVAEQAKKSLKDFQVSSRFFNYAEIYDRRYLNALERWAGLKTQGQIYAICNTPNKKITLTDEIEAGSLFSSYPYVHQIRLNDVSAINPKKMPYFTYRAIPRASEAIDGIEEKSLDFVALLSGLHHAPEGRIDRFIESLSDKMRPGAVLLFREHDADHESKIGKTAIAVHAFINALNQVEIEDEVIEIRKFQSLEKWGNQLELHGLKKINRHDWILDQDPTANALTTWVKEPRNQEELKVALDYRSDYVESDVSTHWLKSASIRETKEYAQFIQHDPAYAYDYLGSLKRHWFYFYSYVKENRESKEKLTDWIFTNSFAMNVLILFTAALSLVTGYTTTAFSRCAAIWRYGDKWSTIRVLNPIEQFEAKTEKEYSESIDKMPFYTFPFLRKVRELWKEIFELETTVFLKSRLMVQSIPYAMQLATRSLIGVGMQVVLENMMGESSLKPIGVIIEDPENQLEAIMEKYSGVYPVYCAQEDGFKYVKIPRGPLFKEIVFKMIHDYGINIKEIAGKKKISFELAFEDEEAYNWVRRADDFVPVSLEKGMEKLSVTSVFSMEQFQENFLKYFPYIEQIHI